MIGEEEKDVINDLKILCDEVLGQDDCYRYDNYSASEKMTMISIVLNLIETQNKMIELMAEFMNKRSWKEHQVKDDTCYCCKTEYGSDECKQCIIEYFRNKAKES